MIRTMDTAQHSKVEIADCLKSNKLTKKVGATDFFEAVKGAFL